MNLTFLLDWGTPISDSYDEGCTDKSDISQDMIQEGNFVNDPCGNIYTWPKGNRTADWRWFPCLKSKKCIHIDNRCDLHPHPHCLYEKVKIVKE